MEVLSIPFVMRAGVKKRLKLPVMLSIIRQETIVSLLNNVAPCMEVYFVLYVMHKDSQLDNVYKT